MPQVIDRLTRVLLRTNNLMVNTRHGVDRSDRVMRNTLCHVCSVACIVLYWLMLVLWFTRCPMSSLETPALFLYPMDKVYMTSLLVGYNEGVLLGQGIYSLV